MAYLMGDATGGSVGRLGGMRAGNRAMSVAELASLYTAGVSEVDRGGSNEPIYASDFSAGVDGWLTGNGGWSVAGNIDGIDGEDDWCLAQNSALNVVTVHRDLNNGLGASRVLIRIRNETSATHINISLSNVAGSSVSTNNIFPLARDETKDFVIETIGRDRINLTPCDSTGTARNLISGNKLYWKNVAISAIGATLSLKPSAIQLTQWLESEHGKHVVLPDGVRQNRVKKEFSLRWTNEWNNTAEAQYIGGGNVPVLPENAYIESIVGVITGSDVQDIVIGDGSDGDKFVTLTSGLTAGTVAFALASRITDGTNRKLVVDPDANCTMTIKWVVRGYVLEA